MKNAERWKNVLGVLLIQAYLSFHSWRNARNGLNPKFLCKRAEASVSLELHGYSTYGFLKNLNGTEQQNKETRTAEWECHVCLCRCQCHMGVFSESSNPWWVDPHHLNLITDEGWILQKASSGQKQSHFTAEFGEVASCILIISLASSLIITSCPPLLPTDSWEQNWERCRMIREHFTQNIKKREREKERRKRTNEKYLIWLSQKWIFLPNRLLGSQISRLPGGVAPTYYQNSGSYRGTGRGIPPGRDGAQTHIKPVLGGAP